jgi:hypothetical protein
MITGTPADLDIAAAVGNNETIPDSGVFESSCLEGLLRLVLLGPTTFCHSAVANA